VLWRQVCCRPTRMRGRSSQSMQILLRRRTLILVCICRFLLMLQCVRRMFWYYQSGMPDESDVSVWLCDTYDCNVPVREVLLKKTERSGWPRLLRLWAFSWIVDGVKKVLILPKPNTFWLTMYGSWMSRMSSLRLFTDLGELK